MTKRQHDQAMTTPTITAEAYAQAIARKMEVLSGRDDDASKFALGVLSSIEDCAAELTAARASEGVQGEVVITTDSEGDCVLVSRQDDEGRILSVLWEAPTEAQREEIRARHLELLTATHSLR